MKNLPMMITLGLLAIPAYADRPTSDSMPFSAIAASLEKEGHLIVEASFDDKIWEVEAVKDGKNLDLTVDPKTGAITKSRPDSSNDAQPGKSDKPASQIAAAVEKQGYLVSSVDFESAHWEVEAYKGKSEWELTVSKDAKILSSVED